MKKKHLIFFDGDCPLCHRAIRYVIAQDRKKIFYFSPLQGKTAEREIGDFNQKNPELDTLILLENYESSEKKLFVEGRAILKIFWHLGGAHAFLGLLSFLPSSLFDAFYRFIAKRRYGLFSAIPFQSILKNPDYQDRFLP
jgi:predicted DCC family thiol-disulfide oxidoreductase YuxK